MLFSNNILALLLENQKSVTSCFLFHDQSRIFYLMIFKIDLVSWHSKLIYDIKIYSYLIITIIQNYSYLILFKTILISWCSKIFLSHDIQSYSNLIKTSFLMIFKTNLISWYSKLILSHDTQNYSYLMIKKLFSSHI